MSMERKNKKRETTGEVINLHGYTQMCSEAEKIKLTRFLKESTF